MLAAWFVVFDHISGLKRPLPVKTIYKITSYIYLYILQVASIKSFIPKHQQCLRHIAQSILGSFAAAGMISRISEPLTKEVEFVDSNYVSNPSLRRQQWLTKGMEEIFWFFGTAKKSSKLSLMRLLYSAVAKTELIFFRFSISSTWKLSKALLEDLLVLIWLYTYKIGQASCSLTQVWQTIWHFWENKEGEYIYHYYNYLGLASFHPHSHQFASAYIVLVFSFHPHSHQFAGAYILLVFFPHSFYHQVASTLMIVSDWKNS